MTTSLLSSYSREQLTDVLRILKLYKTSLTQIGHRARLLDPQKDQTVPVRVEYPTGANISDIKSFTQKALGEYFDMVKIPKDIVYTQTPLLIGGIRIFAGDDMVNISFQKFANQIKVTH